ncbi:MAG: thiol-disulfide oxidoreductase DCC family protein [Cyanobacteriota bacterium]|jgi:predicted DCC family thiol-disulfide oxidoreductase YuxK
MADLTILYDGGCPLCRREVRFLRKRDQRLHPLKPRLAFVDVDASDYDPSNHQGVTYQDAMDRIHAIDGTGAILRNLAVFRRAYALLGLGWLYAPTGWPLLGPLAEAAYTLWARARLSLTGRPSLDQLCAARGGACGRTPNRATTATAP